MMAPSEKILPLIGQTFSCKSERLPSIGQVQKHIYTDRKWIEAGEFDRQKHLTTMRVREVYVGRSFVLLSHEFLESLQRLCCGFTKIVELGAGIGWLGFWLGKYGVELQASIDNKSWPDFAEDQYLGIVEEMDSLKYVILHPEVELFILSWPQEDDLAARIWHALQPGQRLLYIGEGKGGCTASNEFLDLIHGHDVQTNATKEMRQSFLSFDDFHDQPRLCQKS